MLFTGNWLSRYCRRSRVFPVTLTLHAGCTERQLPGAQLAYWNPQWRRDLAPLLDELAMCIDHVEAHSKAGTDTADNLVVSCARCNQRKSAKDGAQFKAEVQHWVAKGKHGEPTKWDGLSSLFLALASELVRPLTATEQAWRKALQSRQANAL